MSPEAAPSPARVNEDEGHAPVLALGSLDAATNDDNREPKDLTTGVAGTRDGKLIDIPDAAAGTCQFTLERDVMLWVPHSPHKSGSLPYWCLRTGESSSLVATCSTPVLSTRSVERGLHLVCKTTIAVTPRCWNGIQRWRRWWWCRRTQASSSGRWCRLSSKSHLLHLHTLNRLLHSRLPTYIQRIGGGRVDAWRDIR